MRLVVLLAFAGCGVSKTESTTFDPAAVPSGVYQLTPVVQDDACAPQLGLGSGTVPVNAASQTLVAFTIESTALGRQSNAFTLADDAGYALQVPRAGQHIDPCGDVSAYPGTSVTTEYTLAAADAHGFDVDLNRTYVIGTACSWVPQTSCHGSYALHYDLVDACPSTCLDADPSGHEICRCH